MNKETMLNVMSRLEEEKTELLIKMKKLNRMLDNEITGATNLLTTEELCLNSNQIMIMSMYVECLDAKIVLLAKKISAM